MSAAFLEIATFPTPPAEAGDDGLEAADRTEAILGGANLRGSA
jgi:hypothetical protein